MANHRYSMKREAILNCVQSTTVHPTAEWVYEQLKGEFPKLSLGTVYRNLTAFKQEGIIGSVGVVDGMERFEGNVKPHAHFICTKCGSVIDIFDIEIPNHLSDRVDCGVTQECLLTFTGVCNECIKDDAK